MGNIMAADRIKVNTSSLNQTSRELQAKLDKIRKDIEHISNDLNTLNSMWEGDAHQTFAQQVGDDISFLNSACENIQHIINYESNAVTEYNRCENQVSDLISQIRI